MQSSNFRDVKRSLLLGAGTGVLLALVFAAGFFARDVIPLPSVLPASASGYPLLDEVQGLIDRHFLRDQPAYSERQYAAIRGMLSSLDDRFTFFIDPPVAASESDALAGTYGGIGVQVRRNEQGEIEFFPYADSPAGQAGIENGDKLLAVNGAPINLALSQDQIDQLLRGEVKPGNGVDVTVEKASDGTSVTSFIPFEVINVPSVTWRILAEASEIGYVQITSFTGRTPTELRDALQALENADVQALVLDLRNNTGGLLQESIQVANAFIGTGALVYEINNQREQVYNAQPDRFITNLPLAVLVNDLTASGAELVAGAIQDEDRGVLIGQNTYGKGTVQQIYPLSDQSSLHVTSAEWLTPHRNALDEVGLEPDISMIPDVQGRDVELGEAIRYLKEQLDFVEVAAGA